MEIIVAYFSELVLTLAVVSLVYFILLTRFSNRSLVVNTNQSEASGNPFAFVFMGVVDEKTLLERILETEAVREKGHQFFFFIDRPFVFDNQLNGIQIMQVDESSFRPETMLEMVAHASKLEPGYLVMLNPVRSFSESLFESLESQKHSGFSFFELQTNYEPFLESFSTSKSFNEIKSQVAQVLLNNPVEGFPSAVVIGSPVFQLIPGQFSQIIGSRFQDKSDSFYRHSNQSFTSNEPEPKLEVGEKLLLPHFHLLLMRFHAKLNIQVFVHSFTKSLAVRFSNQLSRFLILGLILAQGLLVWVDLELFSSPSPFFYLSWISISVMTLILFADGLKSGARSAFHRFQVKRSFRHHKVQWEA